MASVRGGPARQCAHLRRQLAAADTAQTFRDPDLPAGYAAYNVWATDSRVFVAYTIRDPFSGKSFVCAFVILVNVNGLHWYDLQVIGLAMSAMAL